MKVLLVLIVAGMAHSSVLPNNNLVGYDQLDLIGLEELILAAKKETMVDMVEAEGYSIESHYITTSDGYILNLYRIPSGKNGETNGKVAFLQHGILSSSFDWIVSGSGKSLGYILADQGYDVWMGNARGNTYSRNHTTLDPDQDKANFWQFSWHEIGTIDLPAMIDYVLEQTGVDAVYYAGHSQGTTSFYVMTSMKPEYNDKVITSVSLAPIAFMNHMTSPLLKLISVWESPLSALLTAIGIDEFLPSEGFLSTIITGLCSDGMTEVLCENVLFILCGFSNDQMNMTLLPTIMAHTPAGASTRQLMHYAQEINSGKFRYYDLGLIENEVQYGSLSPPDYDLSKITTPVHLIYSENDWLAGVVDVTRLCDGLSNCVDKLEVEDHTFNHLDFTYGIDAPTLVYTHVIDFFSKY